MIIYTYLISSICIIFVLVIREIKRALDKKYNYLEALFGIFILTFILILAIKSAVIWGEIFEKPKIELIDKK